MFRILHTADWHRGAPGAHPVYQLKTIPKLIKLAVRENCEYILVVGDVFDKPNPDQKIKDQLIRQLSKYLNRNITFIFVVGNHDYTTKDKKYHSLKYLRIIKDIINTYAPGKVDIHVLEPGQFFAFKDFDLAVMWEWGVLDPEVTATSGRPLVLAWHDMIPGMDFKDLSKQPPGVEEEIAALLKRTGASYIALGDIHRCMRIAKKCWYSGPPVQKSYVDEDGLLVVSIDKNIVKVKRHRLVLPKKINVAVTFKEGVDTERSVIDFIKKTFPAGNLVKLKFTLPLSVWSSLNQPYIKKELGEHCLEVVLENDPIPECAPRKSIEKVAKAKNLSEELSIILDDDDFGLDRQKLEKTCRNYLQ